MRQSEAVDGTCVVLTVFEETPETLSEVNTLLHVGLLLISIID